MVQFHVPTDADPGGVCGKGPSRIRRGRSHAPAGDTRRWVLQIQEEFRLAADG